MHDDPLATLSDDQLEEQLNPRVAVPDFQDYLDRSAQRSLVVRESHPHLADVRYGNGLSQTLDIFSPGGANLPIHVFIHGGYWRGLDKHIYSELAMPVNASGALMILVNYDLCPTVTLDTIVTQIRECFVWIHNNAGSFGGDRERISVSGHSAGAHLAVAAFGNEWAAHDLPGDLIKSACLVSGIYDLRSVPRISVNQEIRLDADMALRNSVMFTTPVVACDVLVAVGSGETPCWIQQSRDYAGALRRRATPVRYMEIPGEHHFSITDRLAEPDHSLTRALLTQIARG